MTATTDRVTAIVAPLLEDLGMTLYDVDQPGGTLRVMVDREGGVDLDGLTEVTREISRALDESEPVAGSYTLEVSSPGLERPLRREWHFEAAVGETVKLKLFPGTDGDRRCVGVLVSVCDGSVTMRTDDGERCLALADISKATTVFDWNSSAASTARIESTTESTTESTSDSGRNT